MGQADPDKTSSGDDDTPERAVRVTPKNNGDLSPGEALSSLRSLLIGSEQAALEQTSRDLEALKERYGDKERLRAAVGEVLVDALNDVRGHDSARLSRSVSPIVASSIKREIANSKEEMVEALYPITGRLVAASVRNSIASLAAELNERLDRMLSFGGIIDRWRFWLTGKSAGTHLLAQTQAPIIHRAMIIERASGILLAHWFSESEEDTMRGDPDLISGLISAVSNLAEEAFGSDERELRTLDLNGRQVALRRSPMHIVALEFAGTLSPDDRMAVDEAFENCVERLGSKGGGDAFQPLVGLSHLYGKDIEARGLVSEGKEEEKSSWVFPVAILAVLAAFIFGGYSWLRENAIETDIGKLEAVMAADQQLNGFPISIRRAPGGQLVVEGLYPLDVPLSQIQAKAKAAIGDRPLAFEMVPVAKASDVQAMEAEIRRLRQAISRKGP